MRNKLVGVLFGVVLVFVMVTGLTTKDEKSYTLTVGDGEDLTTGQEMTTVFVGDEETSKDEATTVGETTTVEQTTEEETTKKQPETTTVNKWTITDMNKKMYSHAALRVRSGPDTSYEVVGSYMVNDEIIITGKCEETGWYRVNYNGLTAYASSTYMGEEKIATE